MGYVFTENAHAPFLLRAEPPLQTGVLPGEMSVEKKDTALEDPPLVKFPICRIIYIG